MAIVTDTPPAYLKRSSLQHGYSRWLSSCLSQKETPNSMAIVADAPLLWFVQLLRKCLHPPALLLSHKEFLLVIHQIPEQQNKEFTLNVHPKCNLVLVIPHETESKL